MTFDKLTVSQLKEKLKERDLPTTGKKSELLERLQQADQPQDAAAGADAEAAEAGASPVGEEQDVLKEPSDEQPKGDRVKEFAGAAAMSADEKRRMREKFFQTGDPVGDEERKRARAKRFNIETESMRKEKLLDRAKRFKVETPEVMEVKKAARMERFTKDKVGTSKQAAAEPVSVEELAAMIKKR